MMREPRVPGFLKACRALIRRYSGRHAARFSTWLYARLYARYAGWPRTIRVMGPSRTPFAPPSPDSGSPYASWEPVWLRLRWPHPPAAGLHPMAAPDAMTTAPAVTQVFPPGRDVHLRTFHSERIRDFFHQSETSLILRDGAQYDAIGPAGRLVPPFPGALPPPMAAPGRFATSASGAPGAGAARSVDATVLRPLPPFGKAVAGAPAGRLALREPEAPSRAGGIRDYPAALETSVSPRVPAPPETPSLSFAPALPGLAPGGRPTAPKLPSGGFAVRAVPAVPPSAFRRPVAPSSGRYAGGTDGDAYGGAGAGAPYTGLRPADRSILRSILPTLSPGLSAGFPAVPALGAGRATRQAADAVDGEAKFRRSAPAPARDEAAPAAPATPPAPRMALAQPAPAARPALAYLRREEKPVSLARIEETLRREVEEKLERKVTERVEKTVARELAPDAAYARALAERVCAGLVEDLALEKERLGWD